MHFKQVNSLMMNVSFSTTEKKISEKKSSEMSVTSSVLRKKQREQPFASQLFLTLPITQNIQKYCLFVTVSRMIKYTAKCSMIKLLVSGQYAKDRNLWCIRQRDPGQKISWSYGAQSRRFKEKSHIANIITISRKILL